MFKGDVHTLFLVCFVPLKDTLENLRKKKEAMREDVRSTKEDLFAFRPRPLQNIVHRRVNRLRKSVSDGPLGERIGKIKENVGRRDSAPT